MAGEVETFDMNRFVLLFALLGAAPLGAQTAPAAETNEEQEIVVTGISLKDSARRLADCIARGCPPNEEIDASLAHAENQFVAGDYKDARGTLKGALGRNRRHSKAYPVDVSDLERANGRVAAHLGEKTDYQYSTWGIKRALKAGLPKSDPRLVGADIEIAQMLAATGRDVLARETFENAIADARRIGRPDLAAAAQLRLAYLDFVAGDERTGRRALEKLAASTDAKTRGSKLAALLLLNQDDRKKGRPDRTETLLTELRKANLKQPVLVFSPKIELVHRSPRGGGTTSSGILATDNFEDKWIDVGFWVRPDGRVEDVEILRASGNKDWSVPVLKSIGGRQYSPVVDADAEGAYRVERYSYTSFYEAKTGTRVRQRGADARVEFLDLTADPKATKSKP